MLIGDALAFNARNAPDKPALVFEDRRLDWRALNAGANRFANTLTKLGLRMGDRVVYVMDNSVEFLEVFYGLAKLGIVGAPVMTSSVAKEIAYVARDLGARLVICQASAAAAVQEAAPLMPGVAEVIGFGPGHPFGLDYETLTRSASDAEPDVELSPDHDLTVKYTSGTTGEPKGCLRTHRQLLAANVGNLFEVPHFPTDKFAIASPLAAGIGLSLVSMHILAGHPIVMLRKFDATAVLETYVREKITIGHASFTIFKRVTSHPDLNSYDLSALRLFSGTGSTGGETRDGLLRLRQNPTFKGRFYTGFGATEAGGRVTYLLPDDCDMALADPDKMYLLESLGREARMCNIAALDDKMKRVPDGEVGMMAIKAPCVFKGYWNRPEESKKAFRDGWLMTGDLLCRDKDGFLTLAGRMADMIKTGGVNVYPAEIEPVLMANENVALAAVIGMPDPEWGEKVVACVVRKHDCTEADILEYCKGRLAPYKRPKAVVFFDSLPETATGKVVKSELKKTLMAEQAGVKV
jgi:acyl-CoA synthetase (AMP-forming)/AMP-acid ligase II